MVYAMAHAGLGGKVDNDVKGMSLESVVNKGLVGNVAPQKSETVASQGEELRQTPLLQADVVVVVQVVDADNANLGIEG